MMTTAVKVRLREDRDNKEILQLLQDRYDKVEVDWQEEDDNCTAMAEREQRESERKRLVAILRSLGRDPEAVRVSICGKQVVRRHRCRNCGHIEEDETEPEARTCHHKLHRDCQEWWVRKNLDTYGARLKCMVDPHLITLHFGKAATPNLDRYVRCQKRLFRFSVSGDHQGIRIIWIRPTGSEFSVQVLVLIDGAKLSEDRLRVKADSLGIKVRIQKIDDACSCLKLLLGEALPRLADFRDNLQVINRYLSATDFAHIVQPIGKWSKSCGMKGCPDENEDNKAADSAQGLQDGDGEEKRSDDPSDDGAKQQSAGDEEKKSSWEIQESKTFDRVCPVCGANDWEYLGIFLRGSPLESPPVIFPIGNRKRRSW